jgi:hypothetical protein
MKRTQGQLSDSKETTMKNTLGYSQARTKVIGANGLLAGIAGGVQAVIVTLIAWAFNAKPGNGYVFVEAILLTAQVSMLPPLIRGAELCSNGRTLAYLLCFSPTAIMMVIVPFVPAGLESIVAILAKLNVVMCCNIAFLQYCKGLLPIRSEVEAEIVDQEKEIAQAKIFLVSLPNNRSPSKQVDSKTDGTNFDGSAADHLRSQRDHQLDEILTSGKEATLIVAEMQHVKQEFAKKIAELEGAAT